MNDTYKPKIFKNIKVDGITAETIPKGERGRIIQKFFISSIEEKFPILATNILNVFQIPNSGNYINNVLIIIKPDNTAYLYNDFPFGVRCIPKKNLKKNQLIFNNDIADIISVFFNDDLINLNPIQGDKFIWLFRVNWVFGLYFDLSTKLEPNNVLNELGYYYKRLSYLSLYNFIDNDDSLNKMISHGWFPFIALINDGMEKLLQYYNEGEKHKSIIDDLIESFDEQKINDIANLWWSNHYFCDKKKILESGIKSYLSKTEDGYISSVKIFSTELEGIVRLSFHKEYGKKPSNNELKQYITSKGSSKFNTIGSMCIPHKFIKYLSDYIFKGFDVEQDYLPESRHSVAHGVADISVYNKEFAFKLFLTLDNIFYFLQ